MYGGNTAGDGRGATERAEGGDSDETGSDDGSAGSSWDVSRSGSDSTPRVNG